MSDILTPEAFDKNLNDCYAAGYHDGAFPQEPSYADQFEAIREVMLKHDAAERPSVSESDIRETLVRLHGEDAGKFYDEVVAKEQRLRERVAAGEPFEKVFDEMYPGNR